MFDHELTTKQLIESAKPHYAAAAISAAIAIASAAASAAQQNAAKKKQKMSASAANVNQGSPDAPGEPTANKFTLGGGSEKTLMDAMKGAGGMPQATEKQQGMSLGIKPSSIGDVPPPQAFETPATSGARPQQDLRLSEVHGTNPDAVTTPLPPGETITPKSGADTAGQVGGYAQQAMSLYSMLKPNRGPVQPGPTGQPGQVNLDPTAQRRYF